MAGVRPHFKVHLSIATHPNTAVMWSDLHARGIYCELGRMAIEKYAAKTGDAFHLSMADLMAITGVESAGPATQRWRKFLTTCAEGAEQLGGTSPVAAEQRGRHWRVAIRNLAKKHGMGLNDVTPKKEERREKREEGTTAEDPPSHPPDMNGEAQVRLEFGTLEPRLSEKMVQKLIAIRPGGRRYSEDEVQAWFLAKEPVMIARGYKSPIRCAPNWFERVKTDEVRKCVEWVQKKSQEEGFDRLRDRAEAEARAADPVDKEKLREFMGAFGLTE